MDVDGASALVTGGGSGLGAATARLLAAAGLQVVVLDRDADNGAAVAEAIGGQFLVTDVTDTDQVIAAVEAAAALGPLRVAVNCAGIPGTSRTVGRDGSYASAHDLEYFRKVVEVNLIGTFNVIRLAATAMGRTAPGDDGERGAIVNTTSIAAFDGQVGQVSYSASKGGIVGMTLPLARDLAVLGIRVNTIAPGLIDTPIYDGYPDPAAFKAKLGEGVVFPKRLGRPEEFAQLVWDIVKNPYLNGEVIRLDGAIRMPPK